MYIPRASIKKILKEAGAARISDDALDMFHDHINKLAFKTATRIVMVQNHRKGKTAKPSDVKLAIHEH